MLQTLRGSTDFVGNRRVLEERPSAGSQDMAVDAAAAPGVPQQLPWKARARPSLVDSLMGVVPQMTVTLRK